MGKLLNKDSENAAKCPVETLTKLLGHKWIPKIIETLEVEPMRFNALQKLLVNSSPKVLKQQLKILEDNGLIINDKVRENNTISSTYFLSYKGKQLAILVAEMRKWSQEQLVCKDD